jgi:hypothetical protein
MRPESDAVVERRTAARVGGRTLDGIDEFYLDFGKRASRERVSRAIPGMPFEMVYRIIILTDNVL